MPYLSVIIPCYNEANRLPATLRDIAEYLLHTREPVEVLVVDDGSTDYTADAAYAMADRIPGLRVLRLPKNRGKGRAVQYGMLAATGEYALFMDADNATPLAEIEKLWPYAAEHDVVIGSRHLPTSDVVIRQPWYRRLLSRAGNVVIQLLLVKGVRDTQCGFKLFTKTAREKIFARQRVRGFGFDIEVLSIARHMGYRIKEVGVLWYDAPESKVHPVYDAWRTLQELLRIKYNLLAGLYRRPMVHMP